LLGLNSYGALSAWRKPDVRATARRRAARGRPRSDPDDRQRRERRRKELVDALAAEALLKPGTILVDPDGIARERGSSDCRVTRSDPVGADLLVETTLSENALRLMSAAKDDEVAIFDNSSEGEPTVVARGLRCDLEYVVPEPRWLSNAIGDRGER
jgi:hypothetical protein